MAQHARFTIVAVITILCCATLSFGANVSAIPQGNGVFSIQGSGMDGVAGIDLNISYPSSLSSPSVTQGGFISGGMMVANTNNTGSIKIAIISSKAFSGSSGEIVRITFGNKGSGTLSVSASMINSNAAPVSATGSSSVVTQTPGIPFSTTTTTTAPTTPLTPGSSASTTLGTVTMSDESQPKSEAKKAETGENLAPEATVAAAEAGEKAAETQVIAKLPEPSAKAEANQVYGSVLDRFRTYQGEKSPALMTALFTKTVAASIRQEPTIAVSNGKTNVVIIADLTAAAGASPNFALSGARMVSLKKDDESGKWVLEALPQANSLTASVTILNANSVIEFPLTVVPPVAGVSAQEADFAAFLKDNGAKPPKHDLNGDGRHDYLDDFIYTAHYLIKKNSGQQPKK